MWHTCPQRSPAYAGGAPKIGCHSLNALGAFSSHGYRPSLLGQHSPSVEPFAPHRFAILLHLRTSRDFVSRRSAYTPYPYASSTRRVRGVTLTRLPDFGRSRPSIRCAIHGARGVAQYGLPLFSVGRAIRISYARSTRRVRGVTLTRLPDFGRSRPSIRCAIHGARGVAQYGLPLLERFGGLGVPRVKAVCIGPNYLMQPEIAFAVVPECEADVVGVVAGIDLDVVALHADEEVGVAQVGFAVQFDVVGEGLEHCVGSRARSTDDDEFGVVPGFVEADGITPGRMAVVFDHVDAVPTKLVHIGDDDFVQVIAGQSLWRRHALPSLVLPPRY